MVNKGWKVRLEVQFVTGALVVFAYPKKKKKKLKHGHMHFGHLQEIANIIEFNVQSHLRYHFSVFNMTVMTK